MKTIGTLFFLSALTICSFAQEPSKSIHVLVALCDNVNQGIVPVPAKLGHGDKPGDNLYWGAQYGVKTYFEQSPAWQRLGIVRNPAEGILERVIFKHKTTGAFLVADAYQGSSIKNTLIDFFNAAAGNDSEWISSGKTSIPIKGAADLAVYVGHNGLMDFDLEEIKAQKNSKPREVMILACFSRSYFLPQLKKLGCRPLLLTTGLMAPEAYTLEAALSGWLNRESPKQIRDRAARAYHAFQKCGMTAAQRLFSAE